MPDVIVLGGGPAGLQAAHTLGRMHRETLLIDAGRGRNAPAEGIHNFATHDGRPPAEYRALARADLEPYGSVSVLDAAAASVARTGTHFVVEAGGRTYRSRRLILATGLRDLIPDIPGIEPLWGHEVVVCPFCHGHEFAGEVVAVVGAATPHFERTAAMLGGIGAQVVRLTEPVTGIERTADGIRLAGAGFAVDAAGAFVGTTAVQATGFAEDLGLELLDDGCVAIDGVGRTGQAGVFAAGDMAHQRDAGQLAAVLVAAASGLLAAAGCVQDLLSEELG